MALSDCVECWDTPCQCGHKYKDYSVKWLTMMRDMFQKLINDKNKIEEK